MEKAIEIRNITPDIITQAEVLAAKTAHYMGMTKNVAIATYLKGYEVGFNMTAAPEFIQVIQGKPAISPRGHLALLHASGIFSGNGLLEVEDKRDEDGNPTSCRVKMRRGDSNVEYECVFTMEDAKRAGIIKDGSGWEKYPANMCRWRATGYCADIVASDIGGGMKRADEYGADITQEGDIIPGSWEELKEENEDENPITLNNLAAQYGVDVILKANNDVIPANQDDIDRVAKILESESNHD